MAGRKQAGRRTHCPSGHAYDAANTLLVKWYSKRARRWKTTPTCLACARLRMAAHRRRKRDDNSKGGADQ